MNSLRKTDQYFFSFIIPVDFVSIIYKKINEGKHMLHVKQR